MLHVSILPRGKNLEESQHLRCFCILDRKTKGKQFMCIHRHKHIWRLGDWVLEIKNIIDIGCFCSSEGRQGRDLSFRFSGRGETQLATPVWNKSLDGYISSEEYTLGNGSIPHWSAEYLSYFLALSLFLHCFTEVCSWRNNCLIVTLDVPGAAQHNQTKRQEGEERLKRQNNFSSVNHWVLSESFLQLGLLKSCLCLLLSVCVGSGCHFLAPLWVLWVLPAQKR